VTTKNHTNCSTLSIQLMPTDRSTDFMCATTAKLVYGKFLGLISPSKKEKLGGFWLPTAQLRRYR